MLQTFHVDVTYVASVSDACHKRLFKMFHMFSECMFASVFFIWMVHVFHTYCIAVSVFMLQIASVLSKCYLCFTHVSRVCSKYFICFRHMLHSSVSCFRGV
jgi:hypothetical protein